MIGNPTTGTAQHRQANPTLTPEAVKSLLLAMSNGRRLFTHCMINDNELFPVIRGWKRMGFKVKRGYTVSGKKGAFFFVEGVMVIPNKWNNFPQGTCLYWKQEDVDKWLRLSF